MKKNKNMAYAVLGIAFVLFNVIAFAIPTTKTSTFCIAYVFTAVAFASQTAIWKFAFKDADTPKSKFLGIPLISVGITYLIIQIIAFTIFMAFPTPVKIMPQRPFQKRLMLLIWQNHILRLIQ